ncbi:cytochrome P450 [Coniochaeta ligniaria NRRL 30616]|uniref:Cytochrome P450 n=1 Tax=Coniochaeta ligniaria NRRL 30616 TaxID=1408157 RepID=A0A1J7J7X3_9PEZI|nr:cytochrome P450 [Coniochaeta ligniaria NRRL 30616]
MTMFAPLVLLASLICLVGSAVYDVSSLGNTAQVVLTSILSLSIANKVYRLFIYPHYVSPLRHLPGPKDHHFLIGHFLHQYRAGSPNEPYVSWAKKWPDAPFIRYLSIGNVEALLVNSVAAYRDVTRTKCYSFVKPPFFVRLVKDLIGAGLVFAEGEEHKAQKKVLNGVFAGPNIKAFLPGIQARARALCDNFERAIVENDGIVELTSAYSQMALEITASFVLGIDLLAFPDGRILHDSYKYVFDPPAVVQLLNFIHVFVLPIRWFPLEANRKFLRLNKLLRSILRDVVAKRVEDVKKMREGETQLEQKSASGGKDLLTLMAEEGWSEEDMLNQVLTFTAAGHETTATALVWATHALSLYPDIEQRLQAEIKTLTNPDPSSSDIESLHYLNNFSRELFRFFCPAAVQGRVAVEDVVIQGVPIPKGTELLISPAAIHFNPLIWGPHADVFDPDRWDRLEGDAADVHAWGPFLQGPRGCIGRTLAWLEFKGVVVELVRRFRFERLVEGEVRLVNPSPVLRPRGGLRVKVVRRE